MKKKKASPVGSDDKYKEGVDFKWVQGNDDPNSNFKTRHFFTKAEKEAMKAPKAADKPASKPAAPKAAAPKSTAPTTSPRPPKKPASSTSATKPTSAVRPAGAPAGMPKKKDDSSSALPAAAAATAAIAGAKPRGGPRPAESSRAYNPKFGRGNGGKEGFQGKYQTGVSRPGGGGRGLGMIMGQDPMFNALGGGGFGALEQMNDETKRLYKTGGVVKMKEGSAKDMREDKAMAKKRGMTMEKWEKSAADKKHDAPKKMATGGSVRGTGCAKRGKGYAGEF